MDFASLLAPMTLAEFRERAWNTTSLHVSGRPTRYEGLAFDFKKLCNEIAIRRAPSVRAGFTDRHGAHRELWIEVPQIETCFDAGMTICMTNIDEFLPELAAQSLSLRRSANFPGMMNFSCYYSPPGSGFGIHYDDHAVFIFQLEGAKKWRFSSKPAIREPRENFAWTPEKLAQARSGALDLKEPHDDELQTVVLRPGDLLYLPPGAWHKTSAYESASMALTFRALEGSTAHVIQHCIRAWMDAPRGWRDPMPLFGASDSTGQRMPAAVEATFASRLRELKAFVNGLTVDDLARSWAELQSWDAPAPPATEIAQSDRVRVRKNVRAVQAKNHDGQGCLYLYDGKSETELLLSENAWIERLVEVGEFTASDACAWAPTPLSWQDVKSQLEELLAVGIVETAS